MKIESTTSKLLIENSFMSITGTEPTLTIFPIGYVSIDADSFNRCVRINDVQLNPTQVEMLIKYLQVIL